MTGMSDFAFSIKMRDTIAKLTEETINRLRPPDRYGVVDSVDATTRKAGVILNGETAAVLVNVGSVWPLTVGQKVRVSGVAGDKFISDVFGGASLTPVGAVLQFGGATAPAGWLLCSGQTVSRTTYAELFAVISTRYNTGGEAGTDFRLPLMADRAPVGASGTKVPGAASVVGGSATTTITNGNQLPPHTHILTLDDSQAPDHTHNLGSHTHSVDWNYVVGPNPSGTGFDFAVSIGDAGGGAPGTDHSDGTTDGPSTNTSGGGGTHNHNISGTAGNGPGTSQPITVQNPYTAFNYIIKT